MSEKKRTYRKGLELFHKDTKQKIMFAKWNDDGSAACISKESPFLSIPRETIDNEYISYIEIEKAAKDRRRGQAWK